MNTLETLSPIFDPVGTAILGTILFTASALSIHFGRKAYSEPIPNFTAQYTNGRAPPWHCYTTEFLPCAWQQEHYTRSCHRNLEES